jgi:putative ABC transport system permease protein
VINHYLKIALRNLSRQKWLTVINIAGLSIGLACFILFLLYGVNEFSFDRFNKNAKNIFRVYRWTEAMQDDPASGNVYLPMPLGPALKQDIPDVRNFVRVQEAPDESYVKVGDKIDRLKISFADAQIFSMFSFKLKTGNAATALSGLNNIVLTEKISKKYFGDENPIGQTILIKKEESFEPFVVSAIAEDVPSNSTIQFQALGNVNWLATTNEGKKGVNNWKRSAYSYHTYIELKPGSKLPDNPNAFVAFRKKYYPDEESELRKIGYWKENGVPVRYGLQPLLSIHTDTKVTGGDMPVVNPKTIWILLGIAFGVLLIACINFTSLAIGRSASRAREIGIRKVVGSGRKQLAWQFLSEALLLTVFSIVIGLIISYLLLPFFNQLAGKELQFSLDQFPELIWLIPGLTLVVGILSGSYPALVLSRFKPLEVLKEKIKVGGANFFTRSLVTIQFVLSIGLITSTLIILRQLTFMTSRDPGFQKENIVVVNAGDVDGKKIYPLFRQAIADDPSIAGIAGAELGLGEGEQLSHTSFDYKGKPKEVFDYFVDPYYIPLMNMGIVRGRNFDPNITSDTVNSVIINETMARDFGLSIDSAVGQSLTGYSETLTPVVIGIVKDFHYRPFSEKVEPQMFHQFSNYQPHKFFVRIKAGDPSKALATLNKAWSSLVVELPFRYDFLEENLGNFYKSEIRWSRIIGWASGISIFLACLGLLGLAALASVNRTKEIGIRKVLGASIPNIIGLLSKDFLKLVFIAIGIASPLAWYFMNKWLQDFAYRINIGWMVFLIAGLSVVLLALVTISLQTMRAAMANPVKSLRTE